MILLKCNNINIVDKNMDLTRISANRVSQVATGSHSESFYKRFVQPTEINENQLKINRK